MKKIVFPAGIENETEEAIRDIFQEKTDLPVSVQMAKAEAFAKVRSQSKRKRPGGFRWKSLGSVAAAAAVFCGVCIANPAFAEKIPLVGHVFTRIGNSLGFQGAYEKYAVSLEETEMHAVQILNGTEQSAQALETAQTEPQTEVWAPGSTDSYSVERNGMTVTLSEQYCNEKALYLSLILRTEEEFPESMTDQNGKPIISMLRSTMDFSYNPEAQIIDEAYLDGVQIDAHTYAGMLRLNLDYTKPDDLQKLPGQFTAHLRIPQIQGTLPQDATPPMPSDLRQAYEDCMEEAGLSTAEEDYASFTKEQQEIEHKLFTEMWNAYAQRYPEVNQYPNRYENWWVDGPWEFDLAVTVDHRETVTKTINEEETCDIGPIDVTRTPFELVLGYDYNRAVDYFVAVLDADGEPLLYGDQGGSTDDHPIVGHDVSKVYVYVCDYIEYMDELKGYYLSEDYEEKAKEKTYQQLLKERCVWEGEVTF